MTVPSKPCVSCGRRITWRKKWERSWDEVRYCSNACRARGVSPQDQRIEAELRRRVASSPRGVSDDELAGALATAGSPADREQVRRAARRLAADGVVDIVQGGRAVDPSTARGPILIRRTRGGG